MKVCWKICMTLTILMSIGTAAFAGNYIRVSGDLELFYEDAGAGRPLIFITGWTGTGEFFAPYQMAHFAEKYHVIAYDPRGQGRSTVTLEGNTYMQHGRDLRAFLEALNLKEAAIVGWSNGCRDAYAYFKIYGTENISAFVCIDEAPRGITAKKGDWANFDSADQAGGFISAVVHDRRALMGQFAPTMLQRQMTKDEVAWLLDQVLKTPDFVAVLLLADGSFADYSEEAKKIDGKIPVLNVLSEVHAAAGKAWLAENAPHSETFSLGNHMMFREYPEQFNAALDAFLAKLN